MKRLFLIGLNLSIALFVNAQFIPVLLRYDNIETYNWVGGWFLGSTSGYYTNASVSSNQSAAIFGVGTSSSSIEQDWYVLPNVTGLDPTRSHLFKFRLASYRFTSTASTRGVDAADFVEVQLSTDGEVSYVPELRITGFSNAYWDYNNNATVTKTANGTNLRYTPVSGGNRTSTGDGYSTIELTIPAGITQLAVDLYFRINSAGEEWWIDDIELYSLEPDELLPVELVSFSGEQVQDKVQLSWKTAQELNSSHFIVEHSLDGIKWDSIAYMSSYGDLTGATYQAIHERPHSGANYYRLIQYDIDNLSSISDIVAVYYFPNNENVYVYQRNSTLYLKNCDNFVSFELLDSSGKLAKRQNLIEGNSIEVNDLSSGLYYLNLISEAPTSTVLKVRIIN